MMKKTKNKKSKFQEGLEDYTNRMLLTAYKLRFESYEISLNEFTDAFNFTFRTKGFIDSTFKLFMKPVKDSLIDACYRCRNKVYTDFDNYKRIVLETLKGVN